MADEIFPLRYRFKRKTTAQWTSLNPVLLAGEPGIEVLTDGSEKIKYGDGVKTWSQLVYAAGGGAAGPALSSAAPQALGASAAPGTSADASRADHVHPRPTAGQVGADASGTAAAAVAAHVAAADPHPGYLTPAEGNAAYATVAQGAKADTAIQPGNAALSDARTPTAHKSSHAVGGSDALSPADIGAAAAVHGHAKGDVGLGDVDNTSDANKPISSATQTALDGKVGTSDSRLSNTRTPTDGSVNDQKIDANGLSASTINWVAITPWAASTSYAKGALVEYLGIAYRRSAAGTSGATFNTANWQQVTPTTFAADQLPIVTTTARGTVPAYGFDAITYGATVDLSMSALDGTFKTISLTGNITFTTSNRANGRTVTIRLLCDSTQRTFTFPTDWKFLGTKPANIAASKAAVLSLTFFGTTDADCVAAYGVQS